MKNTRRIASLLLALVMVIAMAAPVFAATGNSITIENDASGYTYKAYQIFTGTLAKDGVTLSDIEWGENVDGATLLAALKASTAVVGTAEDNSDITLGSLFAHITLPSEGTTDEEKAAYAEALSNAAAKITEVLAKYSDESAVAKAFADVVGANTVGEGAEVAWDAEAKEYNLEDLEAGYYLVLNTKVPAVNEDAGTATGSYTRYMLQVVGAATVKHKGKVPTVEKKILDTNPVDVNEAAIGEEVTYQITGTMPDNIADYKEYYYQFTDTLSKGLTYVDNSMTITVNGKDVTKYFYKEVGTYDATDGTTIIVAIKDLLALENLTDPAVGAIAANTEVVITYKATVNENAIINGANPNDVKLQYSNNPNDSGDGTPGTPPKNPEKPTPTKPTGETPKDTVETFVTEVHIEKVDGEQNPLIGASFEITGTALETVIIENEAFVADENGTYWKLNDGTYTTTAPTVTGGDDDNSGEYADVTTKYKKTGESKVVTVEQAVKYEAAVGEDGKLTFTGLAAGDYVIKETVTPDGYNSIEDINLKVTFDPETKTFTYEWTGGATGNTDTVTVVNQAGSVLPETGGMGTTLFYIVGGLLVAAAVVLLVTKRRMGAAE